MTSLCLIVEDQPAVAESLKKIVEARFPQVQALVFKDVRVTSEFLRRRQSGSEKAEIKFALIDLGLPDGSGVDLIRLLSETDPEAFAVVVTIYSEDQFLFEALKAGAFGYILKDEDEKNIDYLLGRMDKGEPPISPSIARRMLDHFREPAEAADRSQVELSPREKETLTLLSKGMTVPAAADILGLSPQTVASYVKIIYQKLHVSSRAEAVHEALRRGLISIKLNGRR